MPVTFVSPGAYTREIDQSLYTPALSATVPGLIGTATWGPVDEPVFVTSLNRFAEIFGYSTGVGYDRLTPEHPLWYAAARYFKRGRSAWVVRVVSNQEFTGAANLDFFNASGTIVAPSYSKLHERFQVGQRIKVTGSTSNDGYYVVQSVNDTTITVDFNHPGTYRSGGGTTLVNETGSSATISGAPDRATLAVYDNSVTTGSVGTPTRVVYFLKARYFGTYGQNIHIRISKGTKGGNYVKITVLLGSPISNRLAVVETFDNISDTTDPNDPESAESIIGTLDNPSSNYIVVDRTDSSILGGPPSSTDRPAYVNTTTNEIPPVWSTYDNGNQYATLKEVHLGFTNHLEGGPLNPLINILGTDGKEITASEIIGSVGTGNLVPTGLRIFDNEEALQVNLLAAPGMTSNHNGTNFPLVNQSAVINALIEECEIRGDCMAIIDPPFDLTPQGVVAWHNGTTDPGQVVTRGSYGTQVADLYITNQNSIPGTAINSNLAALYYPWLQVFDDFTGDMVWVPPSAFALEAYAFNDSVSDPWYAPAGLNRGMITGVRKAELILNQGERDLLYSGGNAVNPIVSFQGLGIAIWGQRTLQRTTTALDRVNVRRMLLYLRRAISRSIRSLVFEQNDIVLWTQFRGLVEPILRHVQAGRGITKFKVVMDESTNPPEVIEQNMAVGKIFIQPTKTAEIIIVDFILTRQGAAFEETVSTNITL